MAAIQTIMALFKSGDELIVSSDLYGGTYRLFENEWRKYGLSFIYDDFSDEDCLRSKITENTKAVFVETPTNPLMQEADIEKSPGLRKKPMLLIVDNTFYTPVLQRPLELGADIVIHSATKYLAGHNDLLAGLAVVKDEELGDIMFNHQNAIGAVLSPFDSWLLMRGMKTLGLRMRRHEENARELAEFLEQQEEIADVLYPGKGGMLSFRLQKRNGSIRFKGAENDLFRRKSRRVESFITYPATQTHMDIPEDIRIANGVCNRLLRFSVGIEHAEDLKRDVKQALQQVKEVVSYE